ncbi:MAG: hypothetical protein ABI549_10150 [Flavobacterium sp.]|uniref:hypothetical protein n=1 Tax=Flavobacterium sp. TaxID=239 RepID=UPI0032668C26
MDYEKIYQDFYSKYYDKAEFLIKQFLIKRQSQNRIASNTINEVTRYLNDYSVNKCFISKNESLKELYRIFDNRYRVYETNQVHEIFSNEIKTDFDTLDLSEFSKNYNYTLFIKEVALLEVLKEISRLVSNNFRLLERIYKKNEFDEFEIREHKNLDLEDYPIYKKLFLESYPKNETSFIENENIITPKTKTVDLKTVSKPTFNRNHWNENCFNLFHYLVANYEKNGKIKFINIFYFLKNDVDKNKYAFGFTIDLYKDFIQLNFDVQLTKFGKAEYEYTDKVIPILNGFEQDFRKTV